MKPPPGFTRKDIDYLKKRAVEQHYARQAVNEIMDMPLSIRRLAYAVAREGLRSQGYELGERNLTESPRQWSQDFRLRVIEAQRAATLMEDFLSTRAQPTSSSPNTSPQPSTRSSGHTGGRGNATSRSRATR